MSKQDGGPAFPMHERDDALQGMTLRDYFAAAAATGLLGESGCALLKEIAKREKVRETQALGRIAYEMADAMLEARRQ